MQCLMRTGLEVQSFIISRALSLRNLASGYECGRVFLAGVGPSSSRQMQPTDCLRDSACRLRRGSGMVCAHSELQFGAFRETGGTREAGSTVAESLVVLCRVGTYQVRRKRRAARSSTRQGRVKPLCTRIKDVNREISEGKADV